MSQRPVRPVDVAEGQLVGAMAGDRQIVLVRLGGRLHALDGECTHQYADLDRGTLDGEALVCPIHWSRFDVRTGAVLGPPATRPLACHIVTVTPDAIEVDGAVARFRHVSAQTRLDTG
jgi:nitrite reductase/ring-hydroxylating ferredoxin subunit